MLLVECSAPNRTLSLGCRLPLPCASFYFLRFADVRWVSILADHPRI